MTDLSQWTRTRLKGAQGVLKVVLDKIKPIEENIANMNKDNPEVAKVIDEITKILEFIKKTRKDIINKLEASEGDIIEDVLDSSS